MSADILSLLLRYPRVLLDIPSNEVKMLQDELRQQDAPDDDPYSYGRDEL
jgi:nitrate reductase assembly molybdenum cofactor insertion protein NarJ